MKKYFSLTLALLFIGISAKAQIEGDTLALESVTLNGNPLFQDYKIFMKQYAVDSTVQREWECGSPFDFMDSEYTMEYEAELVTHCYSGNLEFITNNNKVLPLRFLIKGNILHLKDKAVSIDENTTLNDIQMLFPKLDKDMDYIIDEENNQIIVRVPYSENSDDGDWIFTFRNNKLYDVELWWLLC